MREFAPMMASAAALWLCCSIPSALAYPMILEVGEESERVSPDIGQIVIM
jgi:hypothetical protein